MATPNNEKSKYGKSKDAIKIDFAEQLKYTYDADLYHAKNNDRYNALVLAVRDRIIHQWDLTRTTYRKKDVKRVYYLSLEFLMGRAMTNNIINLKIEKEVRAAMAELGYDADEIFAEEPDAGLGNGGLGRLAACFLDSLATLDYPAYGYGIRYNYGIFKQTIKNGWQMEQPDNWLKYGNPWEIRKNNLIYPVNFGGRVSVIRENGKDIFKWIPAERINGVAYDTPVVGYGGKTVNTLRLWSAIASDEFSFHEFNSGEYAHAVKNKTAAETISQVLYPNDTLYMGKELRLKQQYFFVCCSIADIVRRFKRDGKFDWKDFPNKAAIQLNDTHPSITVAELMRVLLDEEFLSWDEAWKITTATLGYTNHTLMPEALEKWPVEMMENILPRHMQIIYEINHRFLQEASSYFNVKDSDAISKMSIIEEGSHKSVRMANLSIIGTHSTNGVAQLHSDLLKTYMFPEFNTIYPERFNNKTNGVTQRRWLLDCNPLLSKKITQAIGDGWIKDFSQISKLSEFANDAAFLEDFAKIKYACKERAANFLKNDASIIVDPDSLFDVQVKRIHEYKRQLMNALNILIIYTRMKNDEAYRTSYPKTTFLFGGKAAPGYQNAKTIIKFINNIAQVINNDPSVNKIIKVHFMPNYRVTMAENIIPATNISQQISTAGLEASGTGNMKFMINGALTIGTLDGANVEIAEEAGNENCFIFGHTEDQISALLPSYNAQDWINSDKAIYDVMKLIENNQFSINEEDIFKAFFQGLIANDKYCIFADLRMYNDRHNAATKLYSSDIATWNNKAVINIAASGKFTSDRTIHEYAKDIWNVKACKIGTSKEDNLLDYVMNK